MSTDGEEIRVFSFAQCCSIRTVKVSRHVCALYRSVDSFKVQSINLKHAKSDIVLAIPGTSV